MVLPGLPSLSTAIFSNPRSLLALAFDEWQLAKLEIRVASSNLRSRHLPEALGFRHEGTLRRAERLQHDYVDHELYGLLHEEWVTCKR